MFELLLISPMQPYFSGTLNGVFHCPLAIPNYQKGGERGDFDRTHGDGVARIPYQLYFGEFSLPRGRYNPLVQAPQYIRRIGETFVLPGSGNAGEGAEYSILASDILVGDSRRTTRTRSTHDSPFGNNVVDGNYRNGSMGWRHYTLADASYVDSDGSARHYSRITPYDDSNSSDRFNHTSPGRRSGQVLPKDMAR